MLSRSFLLQAPDINRAAVGFVMVFAAAGSALGVGCWPLTTRLKRNTRHTAVLALNMHPRPHTNQRDTTDTFLLFRLKIDVTITSPSLFMYITRPHPGSSQAVPGI